MDNPFLPLPPKTPEFGKEVCVLRKGSHDGVDKDHERHSDVKSVQILVVGTFIVLFRAAGNFLGLFGEFGVVFEPVRFLLSNPPIVCVNLDVMPPMAFREATPSDGWLEPPLCSNGTALIPSTRTQDVQSYFSQTVSSS